MVSKRMMESVLAVSSLARGRAAIAKAGARQLNAATLAPSEVYRIAWEVVVKGLRARRSPTLVHFDALTSVSAEQRRHIPLCESCGFILAPSEVQAFRREANDPTARPRYCAKCADRKEAEEKRNPKWIILAAIGLQAARDARGLKGALKPDGLGEWRMDKWLERVQMWVRGEDDGQEPEARKVVLESYEQEIK